MNFIKNNLKTVCWAYRVAWQIDKVTFLLWYGVNALLSILPAIALEYNRQIIAVLTNYLAAESGDFAEMGMAIIQLGVILMVISISTRVNCDLLKMMMYDSYYVGLESLIIDCAQRVDLSEILREDTKGEYTMTVLRANSLNDFLSYVCALAGKLVSIISLLAVAYRNSKLLFWISTCYVICTLFLNSLYGEKMDQKDRSMRSQYMLAECFEKMSHIPELAKELRIFRTGDYILKQWSTAYIPILEHERKYNSSLELRSFVSGVCFHIFMLIMIGFSIHELDGGDISTDVLLMIMGLCVSLSSAISGITRILTQTNRELFYLERQHKLFSRFSQNYVEDNREGTGNAVHSDIVFKADDLVFSYSNNKTVLNHISFTIKKGEVIALVGENGSGKSTLVRLILGLLKPDSGQMYFMGNPYSECSADILRKRIGVFFQEFILLHKTLGDNVGYGDIKSVNDTRKIIIALEKGGALKLMKQLPKGLDTIIGKQVDKNGVEFSGGEKQRIGVSRAHMSDKDILIFDEPASALDPVSEKEQFLNIMKKIRGKTAILVSHRIGFARLADKILVMKDGKIVESGTHEMLMQNKGPYAELFRLQSKWYDNSSNGGNNNGKG